MHNQGLVENFVYKALYHFHDGSACILIVGAHVDDLIWANEEVVLPIMVVIMKELNLGVIQA